LLSNDPVLRDRLAQSRVATLSTIRSDGRVDLVPVTFAFDENTLVTAVDHKPKSRMDLKRLDNVRQFPEITLLVEHYDDSDWDALWWVRVRGRAKVYETGAEWERAIDLLVERYPQYQVTRPVGPAIVVEFTELTGWSAADRI
jgi:PPOX class probable F420-dependent enzyme